LNTSILPQGFYFFERGWLSSNSLLVHDDEHAAVFDTGYVTHADQLLRLLKKQLKGQTLDLVVNSHLHSDHCGGNFSIQPAFPSVDIQIPTHQFEHVANWNTNSLTYKTSGQTCHPFKPTKHLVHGFILETASFKWQIHSAPGHDNDEFIFFEPDSGILISADALWENGLGVIFPEFLGGIGFDNVAVTLDLIESLNPNLVLPGHGPIFANVPKALASARRKLDLFSSSPEVHAHYSAKVLLKFKLLEVHRISIQLFHDWCLHIEMLHLIHQRFFGQVDKKQWINELIDELILRKAADTKAGVLINL
jgi:glyoxylase-like metal-dependent hydrolase (beta-lactamase superfamily II)